MIADGAAIVDIGGESTRPGAVAVPADEELRRIVPVLELLGGRGAGLGRHGEGGGGAPRARARSGDGQRRHGAARRPGAGRRRRRARRLPLPDAHAGRSADDAGRPALRRRRRRGRRVPRGAARASPSTRGSPRSASASIPASASARRSEHNFELVRRLDVLRRPRPAGARRLLAQELAAPSSRRRSRSRRVSRPP